MRDPQNADVLAYEAIRRIDAGEHHLEPDRAAALREALEEVRVRLSEVDSRADGLIGFGAAVLGAGAVLGIGLGAHAVVSGPWYVVAPVAAFVMAAVVFAAWWLLFRLSAARRKRPRVVPPPAVTGQAPAEFGALTSALAKAVEATAAEVRRGRRPAAAHLVMCAARAWSLAHDGPVVAAVPPSASGPEAMRGLARRVHALAHEAYAEPAPARGRAASRHRLARYDHAYRLLRCANEPPRLRAVLLFAALLAGAAVIVALRGDFALQVAGALVGSSLIGFLHRGTCPELPEDAMVRESPSLAGYVKRRRGQEGVDGTSIRHDIDTVVAGLPEGDARAERLRSAGQLLAED